MARKEYDTFILKELHLVPEDQEAEMIVRDLTPVDRRYKYRSFYALAKVSKSESNRIQRRSGYLDSDFETLARA